MHRAEHILNEYTCTYNVRTCNTMIDQINRATHILYSIGGIESVPEAESSFTDLTSGESTKSPSTPRSPTAALSSPRANGSTAAPRTAATTTNAAETFKFAKLFNDGSADKRLPQWLCCNVV